MRTILVTALIGLSTTAQADYVVVLGSYPMALARAATHNTVNVIKAANACDLRPKVGKSSQLLGLRPGLTIQIVGPYETRRQAEAIRNLARRCIPDAFVKETLIRNADDDE